MRSAQTNLAWDTLLDLGDAGAGPLHARLTRSIKDAVRSGRLPVGAALPPSREMAVELGCSRWVVTEAYEQLVAEGYLESRVGSGTRVRRVQDGGPLAATGAPSPEASAATALAPANEARAGARVVAVGARAVDPSSPVDLAPGLPDLRNFPLARWLSALRSVAAALPSAELSYPDPAGHAELRTVVAAYLGRVRGAAVDPEDVTITSGVTDGVTRICRALRSLGVGAVVVEDPGWGRLRSAAAVAGLAAVPIRVDGDGLVAEDVAGATSPAGPIGAAIVSPAHQFPTGSVLAPARRAGLLEWARRAGGLVIEDDYDAEFRYDRRPVATLQGSDPDHVALLGSVSKTLSPALGIGWMATPRRLTPLVRAVEVRPAAPPLLDQLALAELISSGGYDRHMRAARKRYRARRDALVAALARRLPDATVSGAAAGLHLLVHFDKEPDGPAVVERAAQLGLQIASTWAYRAGAPAARGGLVLGYGNLGDGEVVRAVDLLAAAVAAASRGDVRA
jgi:GntR family transcriptional regulator/MocR family aminotransferase